MATLDDQTYDQLQSIRPTEVTGIGGAVLAMEQYANAIQGLIGALAGLAVKLNEIVMDYSNQESEWLVEQTEVLQELPSGSTDSSTNEEQQKAITDQQTYIQTGTQVFNAEIATPQTLAEQIQSDTGTMSQQVANTIGFIQSLLDVNNNLAAALA